jgi:hypothetical protein
MTMNIRALLVTSFSVALSLTSMACTVESTDTPATPGAELFTTPSNARVTGGIFGVWGGGSSDSDGTIDYRMRIENGKVTLANRCRFNDGNTLQVGVVSSIRIADGSITFLENAESVQKSPDGKKECHVSVKIREYPYAISGTKLILGEPGSSVEFQKLTD